ncbi:MAG: hypothetical protein ACYDEN_12905 [Acidimicrobiales bacterium]
MGPDERLRRYQEAGAEFLEAARTKAEELLRDLGAVGESATHRAVGDLRSGGRRTEQLLDMIRTEVAAQLSALGLATKKDLQDLERRLTSSGSGSPRRAAAKAGAPGAGRVSPASSASAATKRAAAQAGTARTTKAAGTAGARKKAAGGARQAPATRKSPAPGQS